MTTSPDQAPYEAALFRTIRDWGITRGDNGVVGGVIEGVGDRIGMARVPARIIVVVAAFPLTILVLLGYAAAWALLPDRKGNIIVQNFGRGIPNVGALVGIAVLTLLGLGGFSGFSAYNGSWSSATPLSGILSWGGHNVVAIFFVVLIPLFIIAGITTAIVLLMKKGKKTPSPESGAVYAVPPTASSAPLATAQDGSANQASASANVPPAPAAAMPRARHWAPARPAPPVRPRRPRVPGPGRTTYLFTLAWGAIAAALSAWLEREDRLTVHPVIAGVVIFVTGLGIILIAVSLAGRKLGFLGFVGIASLIPVLIFAENADQLRLAYAENGGITRDYVEAEYGPTYAPVAPFDPTLQFPDLYAEIYFAGQCWEGGQQGQEEGWQGDWSGSIARLNLAGFGTETPVAATTATPDATAPDATAPDTATPVTPGPASTPATTSTTIDITAAVTYVTITAGTNITLTGEYNAQATVIFADRHFTCSFGNTGQKYLGLTNPGGPTIEFVVRDDQYANTIVIKEVAP